MKVSRRDFARASLILIGGTVVNIWGMNWIPFEKLPVSPFWGALIYRACSALLSLIAIRIFCPTAFPRFGWGRKPRELLIALGVVIFLMGPALTHISYKGSGVFSIFMNFIYALSIGVDEDFFSRGFIFGALERYGVWFAAAVSSIHFGLLHLGNIVWGHQSAAYTLAQVVSAGSFGFLAAALMIFSGSIWVPILMHGLCDFPMQFDSPTEYTKMVTGGADWPFVLVQMVVYVGVGSALIMWSDSEKREWLLHKWALIG